METPNELSEYFDSVDARIQFRTRTEPIPGDFRTAWRVAALCLILRHSRADSAPVEQLHTLWWAIRSEHTRNLFLKWHEGSKSPDELLVRFDPSVDVTIDLTLGAELASREPSGTIKLTPTGKSFADDIAQGSSLVAERAFLQSLSGRVTQRQIRDLLEWT